MYHELITTLKMINYNLHLYLLLHSFLYLLKHHLINNTNLYNLVIYLILKLNIMSDMLLN